MKAVNERQWCHYYMFLPQNTDDMRLRRFSYTCNRISVHIDWPTIRYTIRYTITGTINTLPQVL